MMLSLQMSLNMSHDVTHVKHDAIAHTIKAVKGRPTPCEGFASLRNNAGRLTKNGCAWFLPPTAREDRTPVNGSERTPTPAPEAGRSTSRLPVPFGSLPSQKRRHEPHACEHFTRGRASQEIQVHGQSGRDQSGRSPSGRGQSASGAHPHLKLRGKRGRDAQELLHVALHRPPVVRARLRVLKAGGTADVDSMMDTAADQRARSRSAQGDDVPARLASGVAARAIQRIPLLGTHHHRIRRGTSIVKSLRSLQTSAPPS